MQQVKARYIYILGVKRLDVIIKSWITRKLLSFSQSGRVFDFDRGLLQKLVVRTKLDIFNWS
jgi:hypothetical protein